MEVSKEFADEYENTTLRVNIHRSGSVELDIDNKDWDSLSDIKIGKLEAYELAMFLLKNL